jgi:hypothetical protein
MAILLTREEFKRCVFERDQNKCVVCGQLAVDAHHIIDRSLFEDGGYYLDNGVSLCATHHLEAEQTLISCKELRLKVGIVNVILPEHLDAEEQYDHWGNIVKANGIRLRGELFYQENVRKALLPVLADFAPYAKYPRTYHLSTSPNLQNDDRQHKNESFFIGKEVVGTIKLDGENTNMYPDYIHARSTEYAPHESRSWVKALHGRIAYNIPDGFRLCGENMYAKHSIHYKHLKDYFYLFNIWNEVNVALSWDETLEYAELLDLIVVPTFFRDIWEPEKIQSAFEKYCEKSKDPVEGYVLRLVSPISMHNYKNATAKWVRKNHVQTSEFWMTQSVIPNELEK